MIYRIASKNMTKFFEMMYQFISYLDIVKYFKNNLNQVETKV